MLVVQEAGCMFMSGGYVFIRSAPAAAVAAALLTTATASTVITPTVDSGIDQFALILHPIPLVL